MNNYLDQFINATWVVSAQMAPYLLFGFLMAGVLSIFISSEWIERHLGGRGIWPILKSSVFGVPLPLCSCSVMPVTASLVRHGANQSAAMAFLLSTPQTGVDSILATYALLGPVFAVFRPLLALVTGIIGGVLVMLFGEEKKNDEEKETEAEACCHCGSGHVEKERFHRLKEVFRYGFVTLAGDLARPLIVGLLIAGAISAFLPKDIFSSYIGGGVQGILILMLLGIPIYVCSTASIPIALGFMHLGASPGAALAFLMTGPATNAATLAVIWKLMGRKNTILYFLTIAFGALGAGLLLDAIFASDFIQKMGTGAHGEDHGIGLVHQISAIILFGVILHSLISKAISRRKTASGHS